MTLEYKYILKRLCSPTDELYTQALQIYTAETPEEIYTSSNEITHWLGCDTRECGFEMFIFALTLNKEVIGFSQVTYIKSTRIAILDYISLKGSHRLNAVFLVFLSMIRNYFETNNIRVTYFAAEISDKGNGENIDKESAFYKQIMCLEDFGRVNAKYYNFPLGLDNHECDFSSLLYIKTNETIRFISRETFLEIVDSICNDYYIPWYSEFLYGEELTIYKNKIVSLLNSIKESTKKDKLDVLYTQCSVKGKQEYNNTAGAVPVKKPKRYVKVFAVAGCILITAFIITIIYNLIFPLLNIPFSSVSSSIGAVVSCIATVCATLLVNKKS